MRIQRLLFRAFFSLLLFAAAPFSLGAQPSIQSGSPHPAQSAAEDQGAVRPASREVLEANEILRKMTALKRAESSTGYSQDYIIGPMDILDITVFHAPDLAKTLQVSNDGKITLPLLGQIQAAGLTAHELEVVIAEELVQQGYIKRPQVSVAVREYKNQPPLLVLGAVRNPGPQQVFGPQLLIEVLARAGGFTEDVGQWITVHRGIVARNNSGEVVNEGDTPPAGAPVEPGTVAGENADPSVIKLDIEDLLSYKGKVVDLQVFPGDMIDVAKAGIVYVTGDVNRPGGFVLKEVSSMSILRALVLAEGVRGTAAKDRAKIYRPKRDGTNQEIAVNLSNVLKGKNADLQLRGGDILFVPVSGAKSFFRRGVGGAAQSVFNTAGYILYRY